MDRLEIALEKSRQQRNSVLGKEEPATPRLHTPTPAAAPLEVAETDRAALERNRIVAHQARSTEADVYRQLRTRVLQIMAKSNFKTLAITSPCYGDGKTTVAINLGLGIAQDLKQTVLMVDLDLRKPNLHQYLGLDTKAGLTDYLINDTPLQECLSRPPFDRINILPAGTALERSSEILGSPKMMALSKELKSRYPDRLVIYDMPPLLEQDDSLAFLPQVDAVLLIVRDGVTRSEELKRALNLLGNANVIGTVLNNSW